MLEWTGLSPESWTPAALLGVVILAIIFGWLLPRWTVKEIISDRDHWKEIALGVIQTNQLLAEAAKENTEPAKTVAKVVTAIQDLAETEGRR